jgi:tetratricopeptide (TPR) repeat protein
MGQAVGDSETATESLLTLGRAVLAEGDEEGAAALFAVGVDESERSGNTLQLNMARFNAGYLALTRGRYDEASAQFEAARLAFDTDGDLYGLTRALAALGSTALHAGRRGEAVELLRRSLEISSDLGDRDVMAWALELVGAEASELEPARACRLLGAAEALREVLGGALEGLELRLHERAVAACGSALDEAELARAWAAGRALAPGPGPPDVPSLPTKRSRSHSARRRPALSRRRKPKRDSTGISGPAANRLGMNGLLSPELALVDPELRLQAVAGLPELAPFDFLRFKVALLPECPAPAAPSRRSSLPVAAAAYVVAAVVRVIVFDGMFFLAVAAAVFLMNLLG